MTAMDVSTARAKFSDLIARAGEEPTVLERYGVPVCVVMGYDLYRRAIEALEDAEDAAAIDAALAEESPHIPWEQVKADLGWA